MTRLFAGLDGSGAMRFIGEVERGAACGCACSECGSPLIAKLGDEREWHFAHEAGQERPECSAGATNMLRRLAVEHLKGRTAFPLPRYVQRVTSRSDLGQRSEDVGWNTQFVGDLTWLPAGPRGAPVARGRLDNGLDATLLVEIGDERPKFFPAAPGAPAEAVFWCPVPLLSELRKRIQAEQHIARHGVFLWKFQPDVFGLVETAQRRLRERAHADDREAERRRKLKAEDAGLRWAANARLLREQTGQSRQEMANDHRHFTPDVSTAPADRTDLVGTDARLAFAPDYKPGSAFVFYRMHSGEAWVVYTLRDGSSAIAAWPRREDGWDEALPDALGCVDSVLGVYRVRDLTSTMVYFAARSTTVRASTDPSEFERC